MVGLRPPLLVGATCVRRAKATFAMHKRQLTRAAGVSPPWVSNPGAVAEVYHGGLTPTAPGRRDVRSASKSDICHAQTTIYKSGGRQPAVHWEGVHTTRVLLSAVGER
jgi:hypothetical protein